MEGDEKHKKKPQKLKRKDKVPSTVPCYTCEKIIKPSSPDTIMCKCSVRWFCSHHCKKKSQHFKDCIPVPTPIVRERGDPRDPVVGGKTFHELLKMEDNAVVCMHIAFSFVPEFKGTVVTALPPEYSELTFYQRWMKSIEWFKKAHDLGEPSAAGWTGRSTLRLSDRLNLQWKRNVLRHLPGHLP